MAKVLQVSGTDAAGNHFLLDTGEVASFIHHASPSLGEEVERSGDGEWHVLPGKPRTVAPPAAQLQSAAQVKANLLSEIAQPHKEQ